MLWEYILLGICFNLLSYNNLIAPELVYRLTMKNQDWSVNNAGSFEPDSKGRDNSYHLYFDYERTHSKAPTNDDGRKFSEYVQKVAHSLNVDKKKKKRGEILDADLSNLSSKVLTTLATKVTQHGLQNTYLKYEDSYSTRKSFKFLNLMLLVYFIVLSAIFYGIVGTHWDKEGGQLCFSTSCMKLKPGAVYFFGGLITFGTIMVLLIVFLAFKAYNNRSQDLFSTLRVLYLISLVVWVLTLNVIAIPLGAYLLFTSIQLSDICKQLDAISKFRSKSVNF